jgi:hypothetical protein
LNPYASGLAHQPFSEWNNIDRPPLFETHQRDRRSKVTAPARGAN